MRCFSILFPLVAAIASGCGPSASERTLSLLNTEADRWDGGEEFATAAEDPYGHPLTSQVEKGVLNYVLEVRSNGPDGLPKNSDDIIVTRAKPHGGFSVVEQIKKGSEALGGGLTRGVIQETKEQLGFGQQSAKD